MYEELSRKELIDLFQEALNSIIVRFHRSKLRAEFKEKSFLKATFSIDDYLKRNPIIREKMFLEFKKLENELLIDNQSSYSTYFDTLTEVSKIMVFNIIFKFIKIENDEIDCVIIGETCRRCKNKE